MIIFIEYATQGEIYQVIVILKGIMQIRNPSAITIHQYVPFFSKARGFCTFQHLPFVQDLHSEHLVRTAQSYNTYFPESTSANDLDDLKVLPCQLQILDARSYRFHCKKNQLYN